MELCHICGGWHRAVPKPFDPLEVEDIHPAYCAPGYMVTNEQPELFSELLGDQKFERVAAICSGGEMALFVFLPRVINELILVDHSYRALAATIVKIKLLLNLGAKACREMFVTEGNEKVIQQTAKPILESLPTVLREALKQVDGNYNLLFDKAHCFSLRPHWFYAIPRELEKSIENLSKIRLIHGDFRDIAARGPFDMIYISNACDHLDRDKKPITAESFSPLVKKGGNVLVAQSIYMSKCKDWNMLRSMSSCRATSSTWRHCLYERTR